MTLGDEAYRDGHSQGKEAACSPLQPSSVRVEHSEVRFLKNKIFSFNDSSMSPSTHVVHTGIYL